MKIQINKNYDKIYRKYIKKSAEQSFRGFDTEYRLINKN